MLYRLTGWFDEYVDLYQELSDSWADIWFLFDPRRHRLYLKACVDFYGDFIQLTQDNYYLLDQPLDESTKQSLLDSIYKIAIKEKTINRGIMHFHVKENNLTADMELVIKRIDNIYRNKEICKSYVFNKSLLNKDTFVTLDQKYEKYIREFVKAIDDPELINELYDATGYSPRKIQERKKIIAETFFWQGIHLVSDLRNTYLLRIAFHLCHRV